ncbi:hypothetical protein ACFX2J_000619 [Malus domestica]
MGFITPLPGPPPLLSRHHRQNPNPIAHLTQRSLLLSTPISLALKPSPSYASPPSPPQPDTTITIASLWTSASVPPNSAPYPRLTRNPTFARTPSPSAASSSASTATSSPSPSPISSPYALPPPTRALSSTSCSSTNSSSPPTKATSLAKGKRYGIWIWVTGKGKGSRKMGV